jgi:hypothetical protein
MNKQLEAAREFLRDNVRQRVDFSQTDQSRHIPPPPIEKAPRYKEWVME